MFASNKKFISFLFKKVPPTLYAVCILSASCRSVSTQAKMLNSISPEEDIPSILDTWWLGLTIHHHYFLVHSNFASLLTANTDSSSLLPSETFKKFQKKSSAMDRC